MYKKAVIELFYSNRNNAKSIDLKSLHRFSKIAVELYKANKMYQTHSKDIQITCTMDHKGSITYAEALHEGKMLCCFQLLDDYSTLRVFSDDYVFCDHSMHYVSTDSTRGPYIYGLDQYKILRS
jgi:hypothetical protein